MSFKNIEKVDRWNKGEQITARKLQTMATAINRTAVAINSPREKKDAATAGDLGGSTITDEVFSCTVTESDQVVTDDNGDELTLARVDVVSCVEDTTGRTMTMNITYT